jgi:hypothetical protein
MGQLAGCAYGENQTINNKQKVPRIIFTVLALHAVIPSVDAYLEGE